MEEHKGAEWVRLIGGVKPAVMWFTDFCSYLCWECLEYNTLRQLRFLASRESEKPGLLLEEDASNINRIFSSLSVPVLSALPDELAWEWNALVARSVDPLKSFLERHDQATAWMTKLERSEFYELFITFLRETPILSNTLNSQGKLNTVELLNSLHLFHKALEGNLDQDEVRYFAALSIRNRYRIKLDANTVGQIQRTSDSLNRFVTKKRDAKRQEKIRQKLNILPGILLSALDLIKCFGSDLNNPYENASNTRDLTAASVLCYLFLLGEIKLLGRVGAAGDVQDIADDDANDRDNRLNLRYRFTAALCDAEYVLSRLFGFPLVGTGIDQLFGGGGVFLYDSCDGVSARPQNSTEMPGRIVLVRGGFGSGKTSLALTSAASIAQMGGLAVYFAMEFDLEQTLFNLERLGYGTSGERFKIFHSLKACVKYFRLRDDSGSTIHSGPSQQGAILIFCVSPTEEIPISGTRLFNLINGIAKTNLKVFPRAVIVDSLNALTRNLQREAKSVDANTLTEAGQARSAASSPLNTPSGLGEPQGSDDHEARRHDPAIRRFVLQRLRQATSAGTNLVLLSEEDDDSWTSFGEDISDTVIRLYGPIDIWKSSESFLFGQSFRAINISKSRYQLEHPGSHPFKIIPGKGIRVFVSTETRAAIDQARAEVYLAEKRFGAPEIDRLLSEDPKTANVGKLVYLQGQLGTFKTQFGICFLRSSWLEHDFDRGANLCGLVIGMRYNDVDIAKKQRDFVCESASEPRWSTSGRSLKQSEILTCKLPIGNVFPDEIFKTIQGIIEDAAERGEPVRRVVLDNPGEWEDLCPFLQDDPLFAGTLISFLQKKGLRILVTNRFIAPENSRLIRAILEQVETSIVLDRRLFAGDSINTIEVVRSPRMQHNPRVHQIDTSGDVRFRPMESSLFDKDGRIIPTKVKILCRRQTGKSKRYWHNIKSLIEASMPSQVHFDETGSFGHRFPFELSMDAVFDSLNIVEIDEFELENAATSLLKLGSNLRLIQEMRSNQSFNPRLVAKLSKMKDDVASKVLPFFDNSACILFDRTNEVSERLGLCDPGKAISWGDIAKACYETTNTERLTFSFPMSEAENWNCLFLEILASQPGLPGDFFSQELKSILFENELDQGSWARKEVLDSSEIYFKLLHGLQKSSLSQSMSKRRRYDSSPPGAVISRQWFTTLQQWLSECSKNRRQDSASVKSSLRGGSNLFDTSSYLLRSLPGSWSVSGEWYLGILARSVGTSSGEKFLRFISGREADADRLRLGVGLPVTCSRVSNPTESRSMDEAQISNCSDKTFFVEGAVPRCRYINRSSIEAYRQNTSLLTQVLQRIARLDSNIEIADRRHLFETLWLAFLQDYVPSLSEENTRRLRSKAGEES